MEIKCKIPATIFMSSNLTCVDLATIYHRSLRYLRPELIHFCAFPRCILLQILSARKSTKRKSGETYVQEQGKTFVTGTSSASKSRGKQKV